MSTEERKISLIAAVAENYVIGRDGDLPWKLPDDLKWFVKHTRGKPVIFGRRTFESTGYLPARRNIVVTSRADYGANCDTVVRSLDEALAAAGDVMEVMVLGGRGLYEEALDIADRFYLTVVHASPDGDTYFPPIDAAQWSVSYREEHPPDERHELAMTFMILDRVDYGEGAPDEHHLPDEWRRPST